MIHTHDHAVIKCDRCLIQQEGVLVFEETAICPDCQTKAEKLRTAVESTHYEAAIEACCTCGVVLRAGYVCGGVTHCEDCRSYTEWEWDKVHNANPDYYYYTEWEWDF